jgi:hypothetical protein
VKHTSHYAEGITAYTQTKCRCAACTAAWRVYGREWYRDNRDHGPRTVSSAATIRRLNQLFREGHTSGSISAATGVSTKTIRNLMSPKPQKVLRATEEAILSITIDEPPSGGRHKVSARRVAPLIAMIRSAGFSYASIERVAKISQAWRIVNRRKHVQWTTYLRVRTMYELLARQGKVPASLLEEVGV